MTQNNRFGTWLKQRRKSLDLTQDALAQRVGCAVITLAKIESNERRPSRQMADRLAAYLDIPEELHEIVVASARSGEATAELLALLSEQGEPAPLRPNTLHASTTPLIGREQELEQLLRLMRQPETRLVTLVGPGGVGKTRMANAASAALQSDFPDGVYCVPLAAIEDEALVLPAVLQALGIKERPGATPGARLAETQRSHKLLLVLDNLEQVRGVAGELRALLAECPKMKLLVTSRIALRIRDERQMPVRPLPVEQATELFVERAQAVRPDFALTPANAAAVAELCARLDGLPLAIELAAARVHLLDPQALLDRLRDRLDLLSDGPADLPARHQTLRATLDWSYGLLSERQQMLLARLAIFPGSSALEPIEAICAEPEQRYTLLSDLSTLVNSSLVHELPGPTIRVTLLETVRAYALERLAQRGEEEQLRWRHAQYYIDLAERALEERRSPAQAQRFAQLEAEHDNLHATLSWLLAQRSSVLALRMAVALWWFWYVRSHWTEGRQQLIQALALDHTNTAPAIIAEALTGAAALAWLQGDHARAEHKATQAVERWRAEGDKCGLGYALSYLGLATLYQRRADEARGHLEESVALFRSSGDCWGLAHGLILLRQAQVAQEDFAAARQGLEESIGLWRKLRDRWGLALALNGMGELARAEGEPLQAVALYEESLALFTALEDLGNTTVLTHNLAHAQLMLGQIDEAGQLFYEALASSQANSDFDLVLACLAGIGAVLAQRPGRSQMAVRLLSAVNAQLTASGATLSSADRQAYEQAVQQARAQLNRASFETSWALGQALDREAALELALRQR